MAPFGLSALKLILQRKTAKKSPLASWSRPLGLGWDQPFKVRYASNLDDGPWHGAPLGGFGAGCIGRRLLLNFTSIGPPRPKRTPTPVGTDIHRHLGACLRHARPSELEVAERKARSGRQTRSRQSRIQAQTLSPFDSELTVRG